MRFRCLTFCLGWFALCKMTWLRSASVKNRLSLYSLQSRVESCFCDCWNVPWCSLWRHEHAQECLRSAPAFSTLPRHEADAWHDNETFASRSTPFHAGKGAKQKKHSTSWLRVEFNFDENKPAQRVTCVSHPTLPTFCTGRHFSFACTHLCVTAAQCINYKKGVFDLESSESVQTKQLKLRWRYYYDWMHIQHRHIQSKEKLTLHFVHLCTYLWMSPWQGRFCLFSDLGTPCSADNWGTLCYYSRQPHQNFL